MVERCVTLTPQHCRHPPSVRGTSAVAFCRGRLLTGGWDNTVNVWRLGQQQPYASDAAPDAAAASNAADTNCGASGRRRPPPIAASLAVRLPVGAWVYGMAPLLSSSAASGADNNADGDDGERLLLGCSGGAYPDVQARPLRQWGAFMCAQQAAAARVV